MNKPTLAFFSSLLVVSVSTETNAQHTVTLKSGETKNGKLISVANDEAKFMINGTINSWPLNSIKTINLDAPVSSNSVATSAGNTEEKALQVGTFACKYVMAGRTVKTPPKITNGTQETGVVVVAITIDKYGNVVKAEPGAAGSTTTSTYLYTKAKQAAESVKFDNVPTAPLSTSGTLTIPF
jgi:hypothetical protein